MYAVTIPIIRTEQSTLLFDKRFALMNRGHNVIVRRARHLLHRLDHDLEYQSWRKEYIALLKKEADQQKKGLELSRDELARKSRLSKLMGRRRQDIGLTKYGLEKYATVWRKPHANHIASHQMQKEADRVWAGVEKVLFGNGKDIRFRRISDCRSISTKDPKNGICLDLQKMQFRWIDKGSTYKCRDVSLKTAYFARALFHEDGTPREIAYCDIKRLMFPNGWHYYIVAYIRDEEPPARKNGHGGGTETVGIDPGTSTVAIVGDSRAVLSELAPGAERYEKEIQSLQKRMDKSRRVNNPQNYNEDGTVKKGRPRWNNSKAYLQKRRMVQSLYRKRTAFIRTAHGQMVNRLLQLAKNAIVEKMDYAALAKKSKKTERRDKVSTIKTADGKEKEVRKFKRKKRFGHSLQRRSPSLFLSILKKRIESAGGRYFEIQTRKFKASQYDHVTNTCKRHGLKERWKDIGGQTVQRDLYSAYLICHSNHAGTAPDRASCIANFWKFRKIHNACIQEMREAHISKRECFGF